uniref:hypothetical protein n=1 Tax=Neorhizobium sp. EC2-8 TaxID=3129230 RepID=UPI0031015BA2
MLSPISAASRPSRLLHEEPVAFRHLHHIAQAPTRRRIGVRQPEHAEDHQAGEDHAKRKGGVERQPHERKAAKTGTGDHRALPQSVDDRVGPSDIRLLDDRLLDRVERAALQKACRGDAARDEKDHGVAEPKPSR